MSVIPGFGKLRRDCVLKAPQTNLEPKESKEERVGTPSSGDRLDPFTHLPAMQFVQVNSTP